MPQKPRNTKIHKIVLKVKKVLISCLAFLFVLLVCSCKKNVPLYEVSYQMKQYFVFQKGSYWIYKNDSTGSQDCTYVKAMHHIIDDTYYSWMKREIFSVYFGSQFLSDFEIGYFCPGPNCLTIASKLKYPNDTNYQEVAGPVAYYSGWDPDIEITSKSCLYQDVFLYKNIEDLTVNGVMYKEIIYSKIMSIDSTSENPNYYKRETYFAKNIGIIRYYEKSNYYKITRSFSIIRRKTIQ
jgi:hypothetical protein